MSPQPNTAISKIERIQTKNENSSRAMTLDELRTTTRDPNYAVREEKRKKLVLLERQQLQGQLSPELCTDARLTAMSQGYMGTATEAEIDQRLKELGLNLSPDQSIVPKELLTTEPKTCSAYPTTKEQVWLSGHSLMDLSADQVAPLFLEPILVPYTVNTLPVSKND